MSQISKEQTAQRRFDKVIVAASKVFAQKTYIEASIQEIADEAGMSVGAIYLAFRSKEELYVACVRTDMLPNGRPYDSSGLRLWLGTPGQTGQT